MTRSTKRIVLRSILLVIVFLVAVVALALYSVNEGIPLLEGDKVVTSGRAYGFEIGMTRGECLSAVRAGYNKPNHYLRVLWPKDSVLDETLRVFENTEWASYPHRVYGEYSELVANINDTNPPLELGDRWDIEMPAEWVNSIHLTFENGKLVEIQKSRWLFERP